MGFRYRKSINLGHGFRVNMSKSGPGFSFGGKGFRLTRTAKGNIRTTAYIPNTGLSYQKEFKNPLKSRKDNKSSREISDIRDEKTNIDQAYLDKDTIIHDVDIKNIKSDTYEDILKDISNKKNKKMLSYVAIGVGVLLAIINPLFLIISLLGLGYLYLIKDKNQVEIDYDFTDEAKKDHLITNRLLEGILESDRVYLIKAHKNLEDKVQIIDRSDIRISHENPAGFKSNTKNISLVCDDLNILFLPDALLLSKNKDMKILSYENLKIDLRVETFLEDPSDVGDDANVLGKAYLHQNKDGSADKRYKDNKELLEVEYGVLSMSKEQNPDLYIVFSDTNLDGK